MKPWLVFAAGLAICIGILAATGVPVASAVESLIRGSFGTPQATTGAIRETVPLLIAGIAVFFALQAGLFNVGVEGQLVVGALASVFVAQSVSGPAGVFLGLVAGCAVGALWALPAGWIKAFRGGHEVITTIMLNSVAGYITTALVAGPLKDPAQQSPTTVNLADSSRLPMIGAPGTVQWNLGLLLGVLAVAGVSVWLSKTVAGFELRAVGQSQSVAKFAGVHPPKVMLKAMLMSGALAGLAGAVQALGYEGRFFAEFSPGYGFTALGVALLAGASAWAVIPVAAVFGILTKSSASLQLLGVPKGLAVVVLGVLIAVVAAFRYSPARRSDS